jgi:metacaspase-1
MLSWIVVILDLHWIYHVNTYAPLSTLTQGIQGVLKEPNLLADAGQGLLGAGMSYLRGDMSGVSKTGPALFKKVAAGRGATERARQTKTSPADVIRFSECKDYQTSADAVEQVTPSLDFGLISGTSHTHDELGV